MASSTSSFSPAATANDGVAGSTLPGSDSPPQTVVGPPQTPPTGDAIHTDPLIAPSSSSLSSHIRLR
ncbi:hypothetical protein A2U01_0037642 [Trifolium medium]|uniref:Uncharacterized protein n=1 Tax=Trifolium medium TaxID=97028 RepID=A0A392PWN2_9FABA|nr:hypothetical protein [Trifolium medium]